MAAEVSTTLWSLTDMVRVIEEWEIAIEDKRVIAIGLQFLTCIFSALAAYFWIRSASVKLPSPTSQPWKGEGPFSTAVMTQTTRNAQAAWCATAAAGCQVLFLLTGFL
jgi:hypothetical protein